MSLGHSARSVTDGSTRRANRDGHHAAPTPNAKRRAAALTQELGSNGVVSKRNAFSAGTSRASVRKPTAIPTMTGSSYLN